MPSINVAFVAPGEEFFRSDRACFFLAVVVAAAAAEAGGDLLVDFERTAMMAVTGDEKDTTSRHQR